MMTIRLLNTEEDVSHSFAVMSQLRPGITQQDYCERVFKQFERGYKLAAVIDNETIVALAGYHVNFGLAWTGYLYIEDLVTDENHRSAGYGKKLLDWLKDEARQHGCQQLHLDSGVQRKEAHRFYEREGMTFTSHHYATLI